MARLVYACRFEIEGLDFDGLHDEYRNWIVRHYTKWRKLPDIDIDWARVAVSSLKPLAEHHLAYALYQNDEQKVGQIEWSYPAETPGLRWRSEISIGSIAKRNSVEHLVSIVSTDYQISPANLALGSPSVIRKLCSTHAVRVGEMSLRAEPYQVSTSNLEELFSLLESPLRRLPMIFMTSYASQQPNLVNADDLAKRTAGVAVVVRTADDEVTWALSDRLGRSLSCFDGGIRIYWPQFRTTDRPKRHPLFLGTSIDLQGPEAIIRHIERIIFGVACFRFVPDAEMRAVVRAAQEILRVNELEARRGQSGLNWESYALELDAKLSETTRALAELEAENSNLKANQGILFSSGEFGSPEIEIDESETLKPTTVAQAVSQAVSTCRNLVILPSAQEAATKSPFQRPEEILQALEDLNGVAADWNAQRKAKGSGGDPYNHLLARGWGKRCRMHISDTTRTRYGKDYSFEYQDKKQLFEPHITLGSGDPNSCASIHFILDHDSGRIIIGHVGRHLPNTKT